MVTAAAVVPVAEFSATPTGGVAPLTVQFSDESLNAPDSWLWSFGDGNSSIEQNPSNVYATPGTYTVSLTATNIAGSNTTTKTAFITVTAAAVVPVAEFSATPTGGVAPLTVQFTDTSTNVPTSWLWSFGDGNSSNEQNPLNVYAAPGTYTVSLTATNIAGSNTTTKTAFITVTAAAVVPVAEFSATPTGGVAPLTVQFSDESLNAPDSWLWSFGDGNSSIEQNPLNVYAAPGTYTVSLTATNIAGSNTTVKTAFITVTAAAVVPVAEFSATPTGGVAPLTVIFSDESLNAPDSWLWSFGDGNSSIEQNPLNVYAAPGTYTVSLTATNIAGSNTTVKTAFITVTAAAVVPVAEFSATPTGGVAPLTVQFTDTSTNVPTSWLWSFGDGNSSILQSPAFTYSTPGTYTVSLTATNLAGSDTNTKASLINVTPNVTPPVIPVAEFTAVPTSGVAPLTVQFTDTSTNVPTSWLWSFGDGNSSILQSPAFIYSTPGTYTVSLTATNLAGSTTNTKTGLITVTAATITPVAEFTAVPTSGVAPLTVQFTDTSTNVPTSWLWSFGDGNSSILQSPAFTYSTPGTYTVSLTATNLAGSTTNTKTGLITVTAATITPVAEFTAVPTSGVAPLTVQFTDTSTNVPTSWLWSFGDGNSSILQSPAFTYSTPGTYTVSLTATNTAGSTTNTKTGLIIVTAATVVPVAEFTAVPTSGVAPLTVQFTDTSTNVPTSWLWSFGDGNSSILQSPAFTYSTPGTYTVSLTATNTAGSTTNTKTGLITVTAATITPVAEFTAVPTSGVAPLTVQFTDTSTNVPTSWLWSFGDGNSSILQSPAFTYSTPGTYTVSLTATNTAGSTTNTKTGLITVTAATITPVAEFTAVPTSGVAPLTVQFTDTSTNVPTSWLWSFGDGNSSILQSPAFTYSTPGIYTVSLTATNTAGSTTNTKTGLITVTAATITPVAEFTAVPTSGVVPLTVQFTDTSTNVPTSWLWSFGDGNSSILQSPAFTYSTPGTYTVSFTATNIAGSTTNTKTGLISVTAATVVPVA